jgi:serine palmitoyltransferase
VSSAIPAFAKKGDLLIIDEACAEPILTGANLSRATIRFFRHNDMEDLESILKAVRDEDKRLRRDATKQRRFIVAEGIYKNTGELCPLSNIMELKEKYFYRLILDESLSFGTLGATGRGITEHCGFKTTDVEILTIPLDTVLASVGGVCIGTREVVDYQRLAGAGYCFSASVAPFLTAGAISALDVLQQNNGDRKNLEANSRTLFTALQTIPGLKTLSKSVSPVIHLVLADELPSFEAELEKIQAIVSSALMNGVAVTVSNFSLAKENRPSIMICANSLFSNSELDKIAGTLKSAAQKLI